VGGLPSDGLAKHYPLHKGRLVRRRSGEVRAVDGLCFAIRAGETLGLVGESGCGKTTVLMEILRLRAAQGRIVVFGRDTATLSGAERRGLRHDLQVVFQDPLAALDPRMTVGAILAEPLRVYRRRDVRARVPELLRLTGLEPAHAARYPGELSGGQRQRVGIARALALEPKLLLMDEPFSALDVSVQAGIIALLRELKTRLGLAYLLAAHDLAAVRQLADRVAVMRLGRIAEIGDADAIYETPAHPYTQALLAAVPLPDPRRERTRQRITVPSGDDPRGERARLRIAVPSERGQPGGCQFRAGCAAFAVLAAHDRRRCTDEEPALRSLGPEQAVACHFPLRSPR
jgi:peptide/nickel transport system ATP-binding protein